MDAVYRVVGMKNGRPYSAYVSSHEAAQAFIDVTGDGDIKKLGVWETFLYNLDKWDTFTLGVCAAWLAIGAPFILSNASPGARSYINALGFAISVLLLASIVRVWRKL